MCIRDRLQRNTGIQLSNYLINKMISDYIFYYLIIIGLTIIAYWIVFLYKNKIETNYMRTHIIAEFATAIILIFSAIIESLELIPIAIGMLIYATINISGKYIDERDTKMVIILIFNIIFIVILLNSLLTRVN